VTIAYIHTYTHVAKNDLSNTTDASMQKIFLTMSSYNSSIEVGHHDPDNYITPFF